MVDRFPEAFRRFERRVDISRFESYRELAYAFSHWAGFRWRDSYAQNLALRTEARERGFFDAEIPRYLMRLPLYQRKRKWKRKVRVSKVQKSVGYYVSREYSANEIQRRLKNRGIGIRRQILLRYVREAKRKSVKANREKYTPRKYRK
jgi:hypothetical protein